MRDSKRDCLLMTARRRSGQYSTGAMSRDSVVSKDREAFPSNNNAAPAKLEHISQSIQVLQILPSAANPRRDTRSNNVPLAKAFLV